MSKLFYLALPALAAAMLYGLYSVAAREITPETLVESVDEEMARKRPDVEKVSYELDVAMKMATDEGDPEKVAAILKRRVDVYQSLNRTDQAEEALELLLSDYLPGDVPTRIQLARVEFFNGDWEDALQRINAVLEDNPTWSGALRSRGEFLTAMGDEILEECEALCESVLADAEAQRAIELTGWIAMRDADDLRRAAMLEEVFSLLTVSFEAERKYYNTLIERASILFDNAYVDYAGSLSNTDPIVLTHLLELIQRTGRQADAADFGMANQRWLLSRKHPRWIEMLAHTLHEVDRNQFAIALIQQLEGGELSQHFLPEWLEILYEERRWSGLSSAALQLRRSRGSYSSSHYLQSYATFFHAVGLYRAGRIKGSVEPVATYLSQTHSIEPIPGAHSLALEIQADCLLNLGGRQRARKAGDLLVSAYELRGKAQPAGWMRTTNVLRNSGGKSALLEKAIAHSMAAGPVRAPELEPLWREIGEQQLDESRLTPQAIRNQVNHRVSWVPSMEIGPYAMYLLAEAYVEEGLWLGAYSACEKVMEEIPYFPLAVDTYVEACDMTGRSSDAVDMLLGRLQFLGQHAPTYERLLEYVLVMSSEQKAELMRLSPRGFGLHEMVDRLLEGGHVEEARIALESFDEELAPRGLLLLGEALALAGRGGEALEVLAGIPQDDRNYPAAFELILRTAVDLGDQDSLETVIAELAVPDTPVGELLVPAVDTLLAGGQLSPAHQLITFLDSDASTRSGRNLMRLAAVELRLAAADESHYDGARESLERAFAFLDDGGPLLGHIIEAILRDDALALAESLATVRQAMEEDDLQLGEYATLVLGLLGGRADLAENIRTQIDLNAETDGVPFLLRLLADEIAPPEHKALLDLPEPIRSETEVFLRGTPDDPRRPEQALAYLLAMVHPDLRVWIASDLESPRENMGWLWPLYLRAAALLRSDQLESADALIHTLTQTADSFEPTRGLARELLKKQPPSELALLEFAKRGWTTTSNPETAHARTLLTAVRQARESGDLVTARKTVVQALQLAPEDAPALYELALLEITAQRYEKGLAALGRFLKILPPRVGNAALPDILDLLHFALSTRQISHATWTLWVESLGEQFPGNAIVAVLLANRDAKIWLARNPTKGAYLALSRLDAFREGLGDAPIEQLGPGALSDWHDFYLEVDPIRGEQFLREELAKDPADPELWAMLAESFYEQGRVRDARQQLHWLLSILPNERGLRLWIRIEAERGSPIQGVHQATLTLSNLLGVDATEPEIRFLNILAEVNDPGYAETAEGVARLEELWGAREELNLALATRVGRALGMTLMRVGNDEQAARAQRVFEVLNEFPLPRDEKKLYALMSLIGPSPTDVKVEAKVDISKARVTKSGSDREKFQAEKGLGAKLRTLLKGSSRAEAKKVFDRFKEMAPEGQAALIATLQAESAAQPARPAPGTPTQGPAAAAAATSESLSEQYEQILEVLPAEKVEPFERYYGRLDDADKSVFLQNIRAKLIGEGLLEEAPGESSKGTSSAKQQEPGAEPGRLTPAELAESQGAEMRELLSKLPEADAQKLRRRFQQLSAEDRPAFLQRLRTREQRDG